MRRTLLPLLILIVAGVVWLLSQEPQGVRDGSDEAAPRQPSEPEAPDLPAPRQTESVTRESLDVAAEAPALETVRYATLVVQVTSAVDRQPVEGMEALVFPVRDEIEGQLTFLRDLEQRNWGTLHYEPPIDHEPRFDFADEALRCTDRKGRLTIAVLPELAFEVTVFDLHRNAGRETRHVRALRAGQELEIEFMVGVGADMTTTLRTAELFRDRGVRGAAVFMFEGDEWHTETIDMTSRTSLESQAEFFPDPPSYTKHRGQIELRARSWGRRSAIVHAFGYGPRTVALSPDEERSGEPIEVPLFRGARMAGRVLMTNPVMTDWALELSCEAGAIAATRPVDIPVRLSWTCDLGSGGEYKFRDLPPNVTLQATLHSKRFERQLLPDRIGLCPGHLFEYDFDLVQPGQITGRVIDGDAMPVDSIAVALAQFSGDETSLADGVSLRMSARAETVLARVRTNEDGEFVFDRVPQGRWIVGVVANEQPGSGGYSPSATITTLTPQSPSKHLTLLVRRGIRITGSAVGTDDLPVAQGEVQFVGRDVVGAGSVHTRAGRFIIDQLHEGTYDLTASSPDPFERWEPRSVQAGRRDVVLRALPAGAIEVLVLGVDGKPKRQAHVRILERTGRQIDEDGTNSLGQCKFASLKPGRYDVIAISADGEALVERNIAVREGEWGQPLRMELKAGSHLRVSLDRLGYKTADVVVSWKGIPVFEQSVSVERGFYTVVPAGMGEIRLRPQHDEAAAPFIQTFHGEPGELAEVEIDGGY